MTTSERRSASSRELAARSSVLIKDGFRGGLPLLAPPPPVTPLLLVVIFFILAPVLVSSFALELSSGDPPPMSRLIKLMSMFPVLMDLSRLIAERLGDELPPIIASSEPLLSDASLLSMRSLS